MRVLLTKKLAEVIDGIDLRSREVGQVFELSSEQARLLLAEQWAIVERRSTPRLASRLATMNLSLPRR
jgi:hypothetical protein